LFFVLLLLHIFISFLIRSAHSESVKFFKGTHTHTQTRGRGSKSSSLGVFFIFVLPALGGEREREKKRKRERLSKTDPPPIFTNTR
jgi:hypothetical protein